MHCLEKGELPLRCKVLLKYQNIETVPELFFEKYPRAETIHRKQIKLCTERALKSPNPQRCCEERELIRE